MTSISKSFKFNPLAEEFVPNMIACIKINSTTFDLSLKNNFAVLSHPMMNDKLFPESMSVSDIIYDHFGVVINGDQASIPVSERPFCNITI